MAWPKKKKNKQSLVMTVQAPLGTDPEGLGNVLSERLSDDPLLGPVSVRPLREELVQRASLAVVNLVGEGLSDPSAMDPSMLRHQLDMAVQIVMPPPATREEQVLLGKELLDRAISMVQNRA